MDFSEQESGIGKRRIVSRRIRSTKHPSDINWPFWWLGASFIAVFVVCPSFDPLPPSLIINSDPEMLCVPDFDEANFFDAFKKPPRLYGIRYRDEDTLHRVAQSNLQRHVHAYPLVVQERRVTELPTSSSSLNSEREGMNEPSLEDIELIDVLWRADIECEKGTIGALQPCEQYERDLQLLTEKSVQTPLTKEETNRFEDLSKVYFEDFYSGRRYNGDYSEKVPRKSFVGYTGSIRPSSSLSSSLSSISPNDESFRMKRNVPTPTDEDLNALFEDIGKECSELNRLMPSEGAGVGCSLSVPDGTFSSSVINNVSLSSIATLNSANLTELDYMVNDREAVGRREMSSIPVTTIETNDTLGFPGPTQFWFENSTGEMRYQSREPVLNMSTLMLSPIEDPISSTSNNTHIFIQPSRLSTSNDSSVSSSSSSPRYSTGSDGENKIPRSRYSGKLVPWKEEEADVSTFFPITSTLTSQPRRRGRQSKDEQLAAQNSLPVTAASIAEMCLSDLQKLLKSDNLSDVQKQLIRKIRRRGKNKVAARTCRQRRGQTKNYERSKEIPRVLGHSNRR